MDFIKNNLLFLFCILLLLFAIFPLPYDYYMLLRCFLCFTSIKEIFILKDTSNNINNYMLIFGVLAVLYNPIFKVAFSKSFWIIINLITAGFYIHYILIKKHKI